MRVLAQIEGTFRSVLVAKIADRLRNCQNVSFGESATQGRASMATRAKSYPLSWVCKIGLALIVSLFKSLQIHEQFLWRRLPRQRRDCDRSIFFLAHCFDFRSCK